MMEFYFDCRHKYDFVRISQYYNVFFVIIRSHIYHDDVIKWKHFPRYWPFVREIQRLPVNSPHRGQWRGALMFSLVYAWTNGSVNNWHAGGLRRHRAQFDVTVMYHDICCQHVAYLSSNTIISSITRALYIYVTTASHYSLFTSTGGHFLTWASDWLTAMSEWLAT